MPLVSEQISAHYHHGVHAKHLNGLSASDSLNVHGWPEDMSEEEEDCRGACSCPLEIGLSEMNRLCWSVARWTSQYTFSGLSHDS